MHLLPESPASASAQATLKALYSLANYWPNTVGWLVRSLSDHFLNSLPIKVIIPLKGIIVNSF